MGHPEVYKGYVNRIWGETTVPTCNFLRTMRFQVKGYVEFRAEGLGLQYAPQGPCAQKLGTRGFGTSNSL